MSLTLWRNLSASIALESAIIVADAALYVQKNIHQSRDTSRAYLASALTAAMSVFMLIFTIDMPNTPSPPAVNLSFALFNFAVYAGFFLCSHSLSSTAGQLLDSHRSRKQLLSRPSDDDVVSIW